MNGFISNSCCWVYMDSRYLNRAHRHAGTNTSSDSARHVPRYSRSYSSMSCALYCSSPGMVLYSVTTNPVCTKLTCSPPPVILKSACNTR